MNFLFHRISPPAISDTQLELLIVSTVLVVLTKSSFREKSESHSEKGGLNYMVVEGKLPFQNDGYMAFAMLDGVFS